MLKDKWLKLQAWWQELDQRTQRTVALGGSLLTLFILYEAVWSPIMVSLADLRDHLTTQQKLLVWMRNVEQQINTLKTANQPVTQVASAVLLLSHVKTQVHNTGLDEYLLELKQTSNDTLEMQLQKVEFDKLVSLLISLVNTEHLMITQMSINTEQAPGIVDANLVLTLNLTN